MTRSPTPTLTPRLTPRLLLCLAPILLASCGTMQDGTPRQQAMWRTFDGGAAPTKDWRPYSRYQADSPREDQPTPPAESIPR